MQYSVVEEQQMAVEINWAMQETEVVARLVARLWDLAKAIGYLELQVETMATKKTGYFEDLLLDLTKAEVQAC